ncbi:type II secretion system minor pseudopilin GspI [Pelomonas sp. SE-A7]|uniref:type II secretion system minor pseudopilin GspI n=1 Tax=Pelomonas sp. SE-A7 TaxID=3054953 RepID=UPI00259C853A|nr:type II secretion system minor pseudopilin GspI [Pelomonas sp. SE-A7]MDM4766424.1 type II secretion system minor pseudopilin GspI [Pelomonas sp. SE-A7]
MSGRSPRGFTLIEVLVALSIVAVALAAGIRAAAALSGNAERLLEVSSAQWCAENQLTELRLSRQFPGVGESSFECQQLGRNYRGSLVIRPTPNPNFRRVEARMLNEQDQPLLSLATILGRY